MINQNVLLHIFVTTYLLPVIIKTFNFKFKNVSFTKLKKISMIKQKNMFGIACSKKIKDR